MKAIAADIMASAQELQKLWGWYLALGIALVVIGAYSIYEASTATIASILALGVILCLAGLTQIVSAFMTRNAGHTLLLLLVGALYVVVGVMLAQHPTAGALTVTLLLAAVFVFDGIYRIVTALWLQFPQYGWVIFSGIVSVALGVMLWMQWPSSASWFIGLAVGINFVFAGATWCGFALNLKNATAQWKTT